MWRIAVILLIATVSCGCGALSFVRVTFNEPIKPEEAAFIVPGQTTFHDVVKQLGAPSEIKETTDGAVGTYHFLDVKYSRVNFGWIARFWLPVNPDFILSRGRLGTDRFEVWFDRAWIVREYAFAHRPSAPSFLPQPF